MSKLVSRGRPVDKRKQDLQKSRLIQSAGDLLKNKSYRSITIREVADNANINSAMVRYYFKNKEGLFIALLEEMSKQQGSILEKLAHSDNPIEEFIRVMILNISENSGLARTIHDEMMNKDSALKDAFIAQFPRPMSSFLPKLIEDQIKSGNFRSDLDPKHTAFQLMSLIILPFLGAPVREAAWEINDTELTDPKWAKSIYQLFITGCKKVTS